MWKLSSHNRSLAYLYVFHDHSMESKYQEQSNLRCLLPLRLYCGMLIIISIEGMTSQWYLDPRIAFWVHLITFLVTSSLLIASFFSNKVKDNALGILALCCCAFGVVAACLIYVNSMAWAFSGVVCTLYDVVPMDNLDAQQRIISYIEDSKAVLAMMQSELYSVTHWVLLVVVGLNRWTVASFAAIYVSLIATIFLTPQLEPRHRYDGLFATSISTCSMLALCVVLESLRRATFLAETLLGRELQASQMADSVLNHCLKNTLAEVAANVELYLVGEASPAVLEDCVSCLNRGIRLCKEREVYVQLVSGQYQPVPNQVHLREFGQNLLAGRNVAGEFCNAVVYLDSMLCNLILENALSNAFKHGPANPEVRFSITDISHLASDGELPLDHRRLRFTVTNVVNPERPVLTPELVEQLLSGEAPDFDPEGRGPATGIGLQHSVMAAKVAGIKLTLQQSDFLVTFSAVVDAKEAPGPAEGRFSMDQLARFPSGLKFVCIDDSPGTLRLLEIHLRNQCQPREVRCFGASEADLAPFVAAALSADVAILDQHLCYSRTYYGTDLVQQLLAVGFMGLICIRSGNDNPDDRLRYVRSGAHCVFGKDKPLLLTMTELKAAYVAFLDRRQNGPVPPPPPPRLPAPEQLEISDLDMPGMLAHDSD